MKKRNVAGLGVAAVVIAMGMGQVFAATTVENFSEARQAGMATRVEGQGFQKMGERPEMTDEEKAEMEALRTQRQEKQDAFVATLTAAQKELYESAMLNRIQRMDRTITEGEQPQTPDESAIQSAMQEMRGKQEAFVTSLTESQKAAYEELFGRINHERKELTDEEKAEMEVARAKSAEEMNAFVATLTDAQKELYETATPTRQDKPSGELIQKPDESAMKEMFAEMKEKQDAFIASLSEEQKATYNALCGKTFNGAKDRVKGGDQ